MYFLGECLLGSISNKFRVDKKAPPSKTMLSLPNKDIELAFWMWIRVLTWGFGSKIWVLTWGLRYESCVDWGC